MLTIEISEETATPEDMATALRRIADLLDQGYTSGIEPGWSLSGEAWEPEDDDDEE